jgi:hypothetical protein
VEGSRLGYEEYRDDFAFMRGSMVMVDVTGVRINLVDVSLKDRREIFEFNHIDGPRPEKKDIWTPASFPRQLIFEYNRPFVGRWDAIT